MTACRGVTGTGVLGGTADVVRRLPSGGGVSGRTGETSLSHGCFVPVSTLCHKCVSVMSHGLSPISALSQPGHSNSLTLSQGCHTHGTVTFRDVFETPVRQMFTPAVWHCRLYYVSSFHLRASHTRLTVNKRQSSSHSVSQRHSCCAKERDSSHLLLRLC